MHFMPSEITSGRYYQFISFRGHMCHILFLSLSPLRRKVHTLSAFRHTHKKKKANKRNCRFLNNKRDFDLKLWLVFLYFALPLYFFPLARKSDFYLYRAIYMYLLAFSSRFIPVVKSMSLSINR